MLGGCLEHSLGDKNAVPHDLSIFKNGRSRPQFMGRETCRGKDPTGVQTPARRLSDSRYVSRPHWLWWLYSASEGMAHWASPGSREAAAPAVWSSSLGSAESRFFPLASSERMLTPCPSQGSWTGPTFSPWAP